ncbi:MAG: hypothetical protein NTW79_01505 [Candidatus Berkelbacteria bacterium]|nr:hypothetical protein [Candidatus Berkelbacteria bacterium]
MKIFSKRPAVILVNQSTKEKIDAILSRLDNRLEQELRKEVIEPRDTHAPRFSGSRFEPEKVEIFESFREKIQHYRELLQEGNIKEINLFELRTTLRILAANGDKQSGEDFKFIESLKI